MYTDFYKLTAKPFSLSPDPEYFFLSTGHKRAYTYLNYTIREGEGFVVISGEIGAGKTTLKVLSKTIRPWPLSGTLWSRALSLLNS